jgi:hypothetical protein
MALEKKPSNRKLEWRMLLYERSFRTSFLRSLFIIHQVCCLKVLNGASGMLKRFRTVIKRRIDT